MAVVALVVTTDGRPYLEQCLASAEANLTGIDHRVLVDDSGNGHAPIKGWVVIAHSERQGFVATVNDAWQAARFLEADFLVHLEDDFLFNEPVDVRDMASVLGSKDHLSQIVLRRQLISPAEIERGSYLALEEPFTVCNQEGHAWTEHEQFYSTNPALLPRRTFHREFGPSEEEFGKKLLADGQKFAYWGTPQEPPRVTHIGTHRSVGWKL